ncbi:MAG: FMN-binding negative transcriptional regulator [Verrucomicrobiae bacterium]|nr:FMN-binding negative transcriptional regulator [Verrucomicrobiae bacterium]
MHSPDHFQIDDPATLAAFIRDHSFATIVTHDGTRSHATHVPVLLEAGRGPQGTLVFHLAKANPQWRHFESGSEGLVIFTGPHAYISPAWYESQPAVPTWNYTAVHVYGVPRLVTDHDRFAQMLYDLIENFEVGKEGRWSGEMPEEFRDRLMNGIVGVEIEITRIEGKFKLSQNRSEDASGVIAALAASSNQTDREVAEWMARVLPHPHSPSSESPG